MTGIDQVLRESLTDEQYAAATDQGEAILALACAGSGKSRTLAYRVARLVASGEDPKSIVAFTFTEKAAESIKLRIGQALSGAGLETTALGAMFVGTIHGWCKGVLGEMDARYRQFEVLDDNRLSLYLISRYNPLGLYDRLQGQGRGKYFQVVREVGSAWKLLNDEMLQIADVAAHDPDLGAVLASIETAMDADNYIDFSLMIRRVADALGEGDPVAHAALSELRHLHVDEYQDVNPAQEALIEAMSALSKTLFVCGDDDQAIYSWRGADVSNILQFGRRHTNASEHKLAKNFRSTRAIVDAAEDFVAAELGPARLTKNPESEPSEEPRDLRRVWFATREEEAEWVAERIAALLGTTYREDEGIRGLTPADFAVLMRSTREVEGSKAPRHAAFTEALEAAGISYSLEAGGSVFDRPQVAAVHATFELLRDGNPSREAAGAVFEQQVHPAYPRADFDRYTAVLSQWGREIHGGSTGAAGAPRRRVYPQQLVHDLLEAVRLAESDFDQGTMSDIGSFSRMIQDAEAVYLSIDSAGRFGQILNFLSQIAKYGYDTSTNELVARPDAVTVSTVHKVKGLEFPAVFIVDAESSRFPKRKGAYRGWMPDQVIGSAIARGAYQATPQEEARLFYTALTRAERFLYVSGSASLPGGKQAAKPSRFTDRLADAELKEGPDEMPPGLTEAPPRRRGDESILPTTYSDIRYFLRCPHDFRLRKEFGFSPPIVDLFGFGLTVHATLGKLHERYPGAAPDQEEAAEIAREVFHLKHVPPSKDPNRPGPYERARDSAVSIARGYAAEYGEDFTRTRKVEARFEIPLRDAVISGSIDLMLFEDEGGEIVDAQVIDFKSMEGGDDPELNPALDWTELSLQVQLYARAAREVLGAGARTGSVHLLKDNKRIEVPVGDQAVSAAIANVEWAVERILASDLPMRPHPEKCSDCDFRAICPKQEEEFATNDRPPPLQIPAGGEGQEISAFETAPIE